MKKTIILICILIIYIIFYKTHLSKLGEFFVYIINPLIWICIAFISHFSIPNLKRRNKFNNEISTLIIIMSLIFVISYYGFGIFAGYTNNPYSTTISGIVVNLFSVWLVVCLKEYIRYLLMSVNIRHYKKIYYLLLFLMFWFSDISILSILKKEGFIAIWSKELLIPFIINLLMTYIIYVSNYKGPILLRTILLWPSLFFDVVPDYEWIVVMILNIAFCLLTYLAILYVINKKERNIETRIINNINPRRWFAGTIFTLFLISFGSGFFIIKPVVILTGSMKPVINPGDMVIIRKCHINDINVGDIIEYKAENYNVVHRVISIIYKQDERLLITKGDSNIIIDRKPVLSEQVVGRMIINIPYVGYPAYLIRNVVNNKE